MHYADKTRREKNPILRRQFEGLALLGAYLSLGFDLSFGVRMMMWFWPDLEG